MRQKQSHSESGDKGAVNADGRLTKAEAKNAMARFEWLARKLVGVPKDKLEEEQKRYESERRRERPS